MTGKRALPFGCGAATALLFFSLFISLADTKKTGSIHSVVHKVYTVSDSATNYGIETAVRERVDAKMNGSEGKKIQKRDGKGRMGGKRFKGRKGRKKGKGPKGRKRRRRRSRILHRRLRRQRIRRREGPRKGRKGRKKRNRRKMNKRHWLRGGKRQARRRLAAKRARRAAERRAISLRQWRQLRALQRRKRARARAKRLVEILAAKRLHQREDGKSASEEASHLRRKGEGKNR